MTPEQIDLARRAVADPRWRWEPGMRDTQGCVLGPRQVWEQPEGWSLAVYLALEFSRLPDLTDAATAGVILSWLPWIVIDASGLPRVYRVSYRLPDRSRSSTPWSSTLGEAAVRAWLALGEGR